MLATVAIQAARISRAGSGGISGLGANDISTAGNWVVASTNAMNKKTMRCMNSCNRRKRSGFGNGFLRLAANLTENEAYDLLRALQPKFVLLPQGGCGGPKFPGNWDGANEAGQPVSRPLSRPSPSANLVGSWKGDPLEPRASRVSTFTQS